MEGNSMEADVGWLNVVMFAILDLKMEIAVFPESPSESAYSRPPHKHVVVGQRSRLDSPNGMLLKPEMLPL